MSMKSVFRYLYLFFCLFPLTHLTGCGKDTTRTDTGGANFDLIWLDEDSDQRTAQVKENTSITCDEKGISIIRIDVYDASIDNYLTGENFFCKDGEGTVYGIPSGKNRIFKASGKDSEGNVVYEGMNKGIEIVTGKIIPVGYIKMKRLNNTSPKVFITSPSEDNTVYEEGELITFAGTVEDKEDQALDGNALVWTTDQRISPIGTGADFSISDLQVGKHKITLTATDDDLATGSAYITISVSEKANKMPKAYISMPEERTYDFGEMIWFKGSGDDEEDAPEDLLLEWESKSSGPIGPGTDFTRSNLPAGTHEIFLRVTDKDGGMGIATVDITILENQMPDANIDQPLPGAYDYGELIEFKGTGYDKEDKVLGGTYLTWTSNRQGNLGTGPTFTKNDLNPGTHIITLTARDKHDGIGEAFVTISIIKTFSNTADMTFSEISPGSFTMGSPVGELGRENKYGFETQHDVTITKPFYIQTTEVTQEQWKTVMASDILDMFYLGAVYLECGNTCPVEQVSWYDCVIFCNRLSKIEGLTPQYYSDSNYDTPFDGTPPVASGTVYLKKDANGYRLPTETEWEYAARAGSTTALANGPITMTGCDKEPNLDAMGWYCGNSGVNKWDCADFDGSAWPLGCVGFHPVAGKIPNAWGLYDMHGNAGEWCQHWYGIYPTNAGLDPVVFNKDSNVAVRGGVWMSDAEKCRSAFRVKMLPGIIGVSIGFRVVLPIETDE